MRCNAFVEAWKNHHRRASMILGLSLLSAPLSYSVYAEDGVSNTMVGFLSLLKEQVQVRLPILTVTSLSIFRREEKNWSFLISVTKNKR